ncbi:MAG: hypothetical protein D6761_08640, partial [Candidatus Dadabacteria bacterium]
LTGASSAAITRAAPYSVTATIIDDEADQATDNAVTAVAATTTVAENPPGVAAFDIWLSRANLTGNPITVNFSIAGTATAGSDFIAAPTAATIAAGQQSVRVTMAILDDTDLDPGETVGLTLTSAGHPAVSVGVPASALATINDDEVANDAPVLLSYALLPTAIAEGTSVSFAVAVTANDDFTDPITYTIDCLGDGFVTADDVIVQGPLTGTTATCSGLSLNQGSVTVRLQVDDGFLTSAVSTATLIVQNVAPSVTLSGPATANEGSGSVTLVASATDPFDTGLTYRYDCDGNGTYETAGTTVVTCAYGPVNQGPYSFAVQVSDDVDATTAVATVMLQNVAPVLSAIYATPQTVFESATGATFAVTFVATDRFDTSVTLNVDCDGNGADDLVTTTTISGGSGICTITGDQRDVVVIAWLQDDAASSATAWTTLRVDNRNPVITSVTAPTPVAESRGGLIQVQINATDPVDAADLQYSFDCDGDLTYEIGPQSTPSYLCPYNWNGPSTQTIRIYVGDQDGGFAVTSALIQVRNILPVAPSLSFPLNGAFVSTTQPTLIANNATDPVDTGLIYEFALYRNAALTDVVTDVTRSQTSPDVTTWQVTEIALTEGETYWWRARATDDTGYGPWSRASSFVVRSVTGPPSIPQPLLPLDGAVLTDDTPLLMIRNSVDPDGDNVFYTWQLCGDVSCGTILADAARQPEGVPATTWQVPRTLADGQYFWRVTAVDETGLGSSDWSTVASFRVDTSGSANTPPPVPAITSPADGTSVASGTVAVLASSVVDPDGDAVRYDFELDVTSTFNSTSLTTFTASVPVASFAGVSENTWYWVRVRSSDPAGSGSSLGFSAVVRFQVNAVTEPPSAPRLVAPVSDATVSQQPILICAGASDPEGGALVYDFAVYTAADRTGAIYTSGDVAEFGGGADHLVASALPTGSPLWWDCGVRDNEGYRVRSTEVWRLNVDSTANGAPSAPQPVTPAHELETMATSITLVVRNAVDDGPAPLSYWFELAPNAQFSSAWRSSAVAEGSGFTRISMPFALTAGTTWYWRARASDAASPAIYGPWSSTFAFTITSPTAKPDKDGDGVPDDVECPWGISVCDDTDDDGIPDYEDPDADNDGTPDGSECPNPAMCLDTDADGIYDFREPDDVDTDRDGIVNELDPDDDGDGIATSSECPTGVMCADRDGDGIPDFIEPDSDIDFDGSDQPDDLDSDADGQPDAVECPVALRCADADSDGIPDYLEPDNRDTDRDGIFDDRDNDSDNDGIADGTECGTPGFCSDSDGDTIGDEREPSNSDTDQDGVADSSDPDSDGDGLTDQSECGGIICADQDGDGIYDYLERNDADTDGDGLSNPVDPDDDGDGSGSQLECPLPFACPDGDGDGLPDYLESDTADNDGDGIPNSEDGNDDLPENPQPNPQDDGGTDSDGDGLPDAVECETWPDNCVDTDGDGTPDYLDLDSDNDGLTDAEEGLDDSDGDGIPAFRDPWGEDGNVKVYGGGGFFACSATTRGAADVSPLLLLLLPWLFRQRRRRRES